MGLNELTAEQQQFYEDHGYLLGLPAIFSGEEVKELQQGYEQLTALLQGDEILRTSWAGIRRAGGCMTFVLIRKLFIMLKVCWAATLTWQPVSLFEIAAFGQSSSMASGFLLLVYCAEQHGHGVAGFHRCG